MNETSGDPVVHNRSNSNELRNCPVHFHSHAERCREMHPRDNVTFAYDQVCSISGCVKSMAISQYTLAPSSNAFSMQPQPF